MVEPAAAGSSPPRPSFRRILGHRPFFLLWASQLISQSGDFVFDVALIWLVLLTTGSVVDVSLVVTASIAPAVVLGPFLGVYVDRWNRRRLLLYTNVAEGLVVALLSLGLVARTVDLTWVVGVVLALGAGGSVVRSATTALVPRLVGPADLGPANSLLTFSGSFNQIVGLTIGGVVVGLFGSTLPIEYDALSFFVAALVILAIRPEEGALPSAGGTPGGFRAEFREGLAYLRNQPALLELIAIGLVVNFFGNAVAALFAPYARLVLHGYASTYGLLGAGVAAGAIVGALVVGRIDTRRRAGSLLFLGGIATGAGIGALGLARAIPLALTASVALGAVLSVTNIPISVLLQAKVPGRLLGRVGAAFGALVSASGPLGAFVSGALAGRTSIPFVFLLSGAVVVGVMALGYVSMRALRTVAY